VRVPSFYTLIALFEHYGFKVERIVGVGYLLVDFLARVDPKHARFLTIKIRK